MKSSQAILKTAVQAAEKAGKILMASYGKLKASEISSKSKNDFVTVVDKRSEAAVMALIKKNFPSHGIKGEEGGKSQGDGTLWIIDPLDGTSNYIHQFPMFCVSIGVMQDGKYLAGVVYDPLHKEMFTAVRGGGAYLNKKKIHVTKVPLLADALMATGIPFRARARFSEYIKSLEIISLSSAGMRRGGSAALDLAYVACGRLDGFWELDLSPWDIAAGACLIQEAGGIVTDMWNKPDYLKNGDVLGSNSRIHSELLQITAKTFTPTTVDKMCL